MINILLSGSNGKMGKTIQNLCKDDKDLNIVAGFDRFYDETCPFPQYNDLKNVSDKIDVIIDFSRPEALDELLDFARKDATPIILCTTGYTEEDLAKIEEASKSIPVFKSANMSVGINLINNLLKKITPILYDKYDIEIVEMHHNQKMDAPSGTALLLANTIQDSIPEETNLVNGREGIKKREEKDIGIHAIRGGTITGEHEIMFCGTSEIITLSHSALSRDLFAVGALKASKFMYGKKPGRYSMDDLIESY